MEEPAINEEAAPGLSRMPVLCLFPVSCQLFCLLGASPYSAAGDGPGLPPTQNPGAGSMCGKMSPSRGRDGRALSTADCGEGQRADAEAFANGLEPGAACNCSFLL